MFQIPPPPPAASTEVSPVVVNGVKPALATLSCVVRRDRSLDRCTVTKAEPALCGFGTAALRLASHKRLDEAAARGAVGRRVETPFSFDGVGGCPRPDTP